ncbi:MAG TPA: GNAT family N-acetyltransferase [Caulifigura sp.]|jgi:ribosomal protein S18 acetylase RimI-like enzyme|nr:GNAT family N-acetyltransferase [Caulifigura sp.]
MSESESAIQAAGLELREEPVAADREAVRRMVADSGFFSEAEVEIAVELVDERLAKGPSSGYEFAFVESGGVVSGYACYGEIPCTVGSYDLYWVAVDRSQQRRGIGKLLVQLVEDRLREAGGRKVFIETSSKPQYDPTRHFYDRCGYVERARFPDFYAPGDGKIVYEKSL